MPLKFTIEFFGESSRVDATLLTRIISKGFMKLRSTKENWKEQDVQACTRTSI
jgi:hypothetical protein